MSFLLSMWPEAWAMHCRLPRQEQQRPAAVNPVGAVAAVADRWRSRTSEDGW